MGAAQSRAQYRGMWTLRNGDDERRRVGGGSSEFTSAEVGGACRPQQERAVVLTSGGIDSTVLLYRFAERARVHDAQMLPLFVDYAQRAARQERDAVAWHCRRLGLPLHELDIARAGEAFRRGRSVRPHVPLPHRNLVVLSLALSVATREGASSVALGVIADDLEFYPSASRRFLEAFRGLVPSLGPLTLETPLIDMTKEQVVLDGARLGVDFRYTYSCMLGRELPCDRCGQCERRRVALEAVSSAARVCMRSGAPET
jgi:7-cyano-7-deazaguanine synthase